MPISRIEADSDLKFTQAVRDADVFGQDDINEMDATGRFVEIMPWLNKVTNVINQRWQKKNAKKQIHVLPDAPAA